MRQAVFPYCTGYLDPLHGRGFRASRWGETQLRRMAAVVSIALGAGGCVQTVQETTVSLSCADYIGRPISERIAVLGPPQAVYRITPTEVGYVFETKDTALAGGETDYTVNYMI